MSDPENARSPNRASSPNKAGTPSTSPSGASRPPSRRDAEPPKSKGKFPLYAGIVAAAAAAFLLFPKGDGPLGEDHANWKYHEGVSKGEVAKVSREGKQVINTVGIGTADLATEVESKVKAALAQGDNSSARDLITGGAVAPDGEAQPDLDAKLVEQIKSGEVRLYNITLWDTCAEDGDVAEILVDGKPFRRIGLFNARQEVVIPLPPGKPTQIVIRGIVDGGGGITLGCQTSKGEHFAQVMTPGQSIILPFSF